MTHEDHSEIHALYCTITKRSMPLTTKEHWHWNVWKARGWVKDDLITVVNFINRRIKEKRRFSESLRLHNLIDPSRFADDLVDARIEASRPLRTSRDRILEATGRPPKQPNRVRSAADILAASEAFKQFVALKQSL